MSSNIEIQRICEHCGNEFTARTTVTKYCSQKCASRAYKARTRKKKIAKSEAETSRIKTLPIEQLKAKEFLTVSDTAALLGCSKRTVYRLIDNGTIKAVNLAERMTRVKRSQLDKLLEAPQPKPEPKQEIKQYDISECYTISEILAKYNVSSGALYNIIKRNQMPKIQKWKNVYVPKEMIDSILG
jgi:excisionase family DNA binding protein